MATHHISACPTAAEAEAAFCGLHDCQRRNGLLGVSLFAMAPRTDAATDC